MNLEVYRDALSARPHRARGAAHRHPAALVLQHVVHRALHVATLAGAGIHLSSHHAALVYGGAPLVRRTVDALARRGNRDRAPDRSVTHHGTATAQGGVTSGAPSGRAVRARRRTTSRPGRPPRASGKPRSSAASARAASPVRSLPHR